MQVALTGREVPIVIQYSTVRPQWLIIAVVLK